MVISALQTGMLLTTAIAGVAGGYYFFIGNGKEAEARLKKEVKETIKKGKHEAEEVITEAKSHLHEIKQEAQEENQRLEAQIDRLKEAIKIKEKHINDRSSQNGALKKQVKDELEAIQNLKQEMAGQNTEMVEALASRSGTTTEKAIKDVTVEFANDLAARKEKSVKKRLEETEEHVVKTAQELLTIALQKYGGGSSVDRSNSLVEVKNERFKAALVGKEGELIEHLESKFEDMSIVFNDMPKTISLSGGKLLRRQVAKQTIELLKKRRSLKISSKDIDSAVAEAERKVQRIMTERAKNACKIIGIKDVPEGVMTHIGRLHFRTSYGQNALRHCIEVGMFAGLLAAEVGADIKVARIAGFFHDIGKSLSEESDKGHDYITKDILEEYNYPEDIIHAAWAHHEAETPRTFEAKIVMAADALSASRPGARLESLERYIERIKALESTAGSFPGIKKTFALSAGREVRVMVHPKEITDEQLNELAHNIAHKIEDELTYPGNVKVTLIRRQKWDAVAGGGKPKSSRN